MFLNGYINQKDAILKKMNYTGKCKITDKEFHIELIESTESLLHVHQTSSRHKSIQQCLHAQKYVFKHTVFAFDPVLFARVCVCVCVAAVKKMLSILPAGSLRTDPTQQKTRQRRLAWPSITVQHDKLTFTMMYVVSHRFQLIKSLPTGLRETSAAPLYSHRYTRKH